MADIIHLSRRRIPWYLRVRGNPLDLNDREFCRRYRVDRETFLHICDFLQADLQRCTNGYSVEIQVLSALRLLGSGSFQTVIADDNFVMLSQSTVSRNLHRVCNALARKHAAYIKFPTTVGERMANKRAFYNTSAFPNVLGVIDCTHIRLQKPNRDDWFVYLNRKSQFSINVQLVCDVNMKILDVVARWPGSTHDSFIWNMSGLRQLLLQGERDNFLLGDSGYPLEPWLMTPFMDATTPSEEQFNVRLRRTRTVIERCNGLLKSRFRCLHESGGVLVYRPEKVCCIVLATAVLHNICMLRNVQLPDEEVLEEDLDEQTAYEYDSSATQMRLRIQASQIRDRLARNLYLNR